MLTLRDHITIINTDMGFHPKSPNVCPNKNMNKKPKTNLKQVHTAYS